MSDVLPNLLSFHAFVRTQFHCDIQCLQTDNGREFDNSAMRAFFTTHGISFRLTCPYTSQQNGRAERILRTLNDSLRTLLFHASVPLSFWPDALATTTYLLKRRPCHRCANYTPYELLYGVAPSYDHLRVFGYRCYPNTAATTPHKLAPRSVACIFLGYPVEQKGYRCYDPTTHRIITSRHVYFDEHVFPFAQVQSSPSTSRVSAPSQLQDLLPDITAHPARTTRSPQRPAALRASSPIDASHASPSVPHHTSSIAPNAHAGPQNTLPSPQLQAAARLRHHMTTRARAGIIQPNSRYAHIATTPQSGPPSSASGVPTPSAPPSSVRYALRDPEWRKAIEDEYHVLLGNGTWTLVPRPPGVHIITGKWLWKNKLNPDGSLERCKARWVVRGNTQRASVDFHQTFSPVVKPATIRTVLHLAASRAWPVHQLDVKNAFLHGDLAERVYCRQPTRFIDTEHPDHVCLLVKSLYGLKQAPRAWFDRLRTYLLQLGFRATGSDASLFVFNSGGETAYLLVYVDDIILTASTPALLRRIVDQLSNEFAIKDLGALKFFLGVQVTRDAGGFFLTQSQYAEDVLERAGMMNCKPASTPADTKLKLSLQDGKPLFDQDASFYRSIVGALQYLTLTRPDVAYAVNQACLYMHAPRDIHWNLVKCILCYLRGTLNQGLAITASATDQLTAYSDAD
jgi:histone deacetylase 1/2